MEILYENYEYLDISRYLCTYLLGEQTLEILYRLRKLLFIDKQLLNHHNDVFENRQKILWFINKFSDKKKHEKDIRYRIIKSH